MAEGLQIQGNAARHVPGYEQYAVDTQGGVWRWYGQPKRPDRATYANQWRKLKPRKHKATGYVRYHLGAGCEVAGHRLVLSVWVGEPVEGQEACHNNGIRDDNRVDNLRWDTRSGNHHDKHAHGTMMAGESHYAAKLTQQQVQTIRQELIEYRTTGRALARRFNVSESLISGIKNNRRWKNREVCHRVNR